MLSSAELAQLRSDIAELLPDTCDIERPTFATDSSGIAVPTYGTQVSGAACRVDPYNKQDASGMVAEREASRTYFIVTLAHNVDLMEGDRLSYSGDTLEVMQLHEIHSNQATTRALCVRIDA